MGALSHEGLAAALASRIRGEVRFDSGSRALYATDASNYRQVPIGIVVPQDNEDVMNAMAACRDASAPVLPRGGGTSLAGQCCNVAVVFDFTKHMHRVLEIDPVGRCARVQPGTALDTLRTAAAAEIRSRVAKRFSPSTGSSSFAKTTAKVRRPACSWRSWVFIAA